MHPCTSSKLAERVAVVRLQAQHQLQAVQGAYDALQGPSCPEQARPAPNGALTLRDALMTSEVTVRPKHEDVFSLRHGERFTSDGTPQQTDGRVALTRAVPLDDFGDLSSCDDTPLDWSAARAYRDTLEATKLDPHLRAELYFQAWPKHKPDYFRDRSNELMRDAFGYGDGPACRLLSCLQTPAAFNLHAEHLGLPREAAYGDPWNDKALYRRWKRAIKRHFRGPCHWRLERGWNGRVHAHVIADIDDGPPELPRGGEIVKPCLHYFDEAVRYHFNPPPWTVENLASYYAAKDREGRLPDMSGYLNVPNTRTWNNPSSSGFTFQKQPLSPDQDDLNPRNAVSTSDTHEHLPRYSTTTSTTSTRYSSPATPLQHQPTTATAPPVAPSPLRGHSEQVRRLERLTRPHRWESYAAALKASQPLPSSPPSVG